MSKIEPEISVSAPWLQTQREILVRVALIHELSPQVKEFALTPVAGGQLPTFSAGSHVSVNLTLDGETKSKPYSLTSHPDHRDHYRIVVGRGTSVGGVSSFMHDLATVGMTLQILPPVGGMALALDAEKHVFIAGGMGVTPFLSHCAALADADDDYELHYSTRTAAEAIFTKTLAQSMPANSFYSYTSREGRRLDVQALMATQPPVTHFYVSGPRALVEAVIAAAQTLGLPACHIHFERSMEIAPELSHYINDWRKFELVVG